MPPLKVFAPAKINLALHVLGRRSDGYHDLDSAVAFADIGDTLAMNVANATTLSVDGPFAGSVPVTSDNLVLRAHAALATLAPVPPVAFQLTKNLPVASGIGGGSADAAAALQGLLSLFNLDIAAADLSRTALQLGADVPVCLHGRACRMQGVGDVLSSLPALPAPALVMVNPLQSCSTADVFRAMALAPGAPGGTPLDLEAVASWRNDMTEAAKKVLPVVADVLNALQAWPNAGAVRMSGSGATCFALFHSRVQADEAALGLSLRYPQWWIKAASLS